MSSYKTLRPGEGYMDLEKERTNQQSWKQVQNVEQR